MNQTQKTFSPQLTGVPACDIIKAQQRRVTCPACRTTLLFPKPTTVAKDLPLWCRRCKREVIVNISPEPEP